MSQENNKNHSSRTSHGVEDSLPLDVVDREIDSSISSEVAGFTRFLKKIRFVPLFVLCVAIGGVVGLYFQPPGLKFLFRTFGLEPGAGTSSPIAIPAPKPAQEATLDQTERASRVIGLGRLLPEGEVVTIALPSGAGDAKIAEVRTFEGARVLAGDILAVLDNEGRLKNAIEVSRAMVDVREAGLAHARDSVRASLEEAQATLARLKSVAFAAEQDFQRSKRLYEQKFVSEAVLEKAESAANQAKQNVEQAQATLSRYFTDGASTQSDVVVAQKNLAAAKTELTTAEQNLEQAYVRSPIAGTVLDIHTRAGEKPDASGVLDIGNIDRMIAKVEIYQAEIGKVSPGARVEISGNALPDILTGTVERIGLQVKRQSVIDADPAANTDARVFEVIVRLDKPSSQIASRFTNLQVRAKILTDKPS